MQLRYYRELELEHMCKEAQKLRETCSDLEDALHEIENYLAHLQNMAVEVSYRGGFPQMVWKNPRKNGI